MTSAIGRMIRPPTQMCPLCKRESVFYREENYGLFLSRVRVYWECILCNARFAVKSGTVWIDNGAKK